MSHQHTHQMCQLCAVMTNLTWDASLDLSWPTISCLRKPFLHSDTHTVWHLCSGAFCSCKGVNTHSGQRKETESSDDEMKMHHPDSSRPADFLTNTLVFSHRSTVFGRPHLWMEASASTDNSQQRHLEQEQLVRSFFDIRRILIHFCWMDPDMLACSDWLS